MKTNACSALVLGVALCTAISAAAHTPVGVLAIDGRQGDQHGWPAGYETTAAAGTRELSATTRPVPGAQQEPPGASAEVELLFWQSIADSTNPAEFEAYLRRFPNGMFSELAQIRLEALSAGSNAGSVSTGRPTGGTGSPASGSRMPGAGGTTGGDAPRRAGDVFRDCPECPEMVVLGGGRLAMGRYEVTVAEYRGFVSATGGTGDDFWRHHDWFPQTDRHPVAFVSWNDAQEYVLWLSRRTGAAYRLPTEAEWERAVAGTPAGVGCGRRSLSEGPCPVGSYGANAAGLSDMVGNLWEWTSDCSEYDCVVRGGSWHECALPPSGARYEMFDFNRSCDIGFRVSRTLD